MTSRQSVKLYGAMILLACFTAVAAVVWHVDRIFVQPSPQTQYDATTK